MKIESTLITNEEVERLIKLKAHDIETDDDLIALAEIFDEDLDSEEDHEPKTEKSLEFLTGGERYIQD